MAYKLCIEIYSYIRKTADWTMSWVDHYDLYDIHLETSSIPKRKHLRCARLCININWVGLPYEGYAQLF